MKVGDIVELRDTRGKHNWHPGRINYKVRWTPDCTGCATYHGRYELKYYVKPSTLEKELKQ